MKRLMCRRPLTVGVVVFCCVGLGFFLWWLARAPARLIYSYAIHPTRNLAIFPEAVSVSVQQWVRVHDPAATNAVLQVIAVDKRTSYPTGSVQDMLLERAKSGQY